MLHVEIEIQTIYFYVKAPINYCCMQLNDSMNAVLLNSKLKCQCYDVQQFNEKAEINIPYELRDKKKLKLIFYENNSKYGQAVINLAFYVDHNLQGISDKISIQSEFDQDAELTISISWQLIEKSPEQMKILNPVGSPRHGQSPNRLAGSKRLEEANEKRTVHQTYSQWKDHTEYLRVEYERKIREPKPVSKKKVVGDEKPWEEGLRQPEVRLASPTRRLGTPHKRIINIEEQVVRQKEKDLEQLKNDLKSIDKSIKKMNSQEHRYESKLTQKLHPQSIDLRNQNLETFVEVDITQSDKSSKKQNSIQQSSGEKEKKSKQPQFKQEVPKINNDIIQSKPIPKSEFKNQKSPLRITQQVIQQPPKQKVIEIENSQIKSTEVQNFEEKYNVLLQSYNVLQDKFNSSENEFTLLSQTYNSLRDQYFQLINDTQEQLKSNQLTNSGNANQDFTKKQIDFLQNEIKILQSNVDQANQNLESTQQIVINLRKEKDKSQQDLLNLRREKEKVESENQNNLREKQKLEQDNMALQKEREKNQLEIYNLRNNLIQINQEIDRLSNECILMKQQMNNQSQKSSFAVPQTGSNTKLDIKQDTMLINQLKAQLENAEQYQGKLREEVDNAKRQIQQFEKDNGNLKRQIENLHQANQSCEEEICSLKEQLEEKKQELIRISTINKKENQADLIDSFKQQIKIKQSEIDEKSEQIQQYQLHLQQLEKELQLKENSDSKAIYQEIERLERENKKLQDFIQELQTDKELLQRQLLSDKQNEKLQSETHFKGSSFKANDFEDQSFTSEINQLRIQQQRDNVKIDSLQKELAIQQTISELSESEKAKLQEDLTEKEEQLISQKQKIADILNLIMIKGDAKYMDDIEKYLQINKFSLR